MATSRGQRLPRRCGFMGWIAGALVMVGLAGCAHSSGPGAAHPLPAAAEPSPPPPSPPPPPPPPPGDEALAAEARMAAEREHRERELAARQARSSMQGEAEARAMAEREAQAARAAIADPRTPVAATHGEPVTRQAPTASTVPDIRGAALEPQPGDAPPAETDEVDALLERLRVGNIAFNAPRTINIEETVRVRALVSPDETAATLESRIDAPGDRIVAPLQTSKLMEARLTGEGFRIVAVSSARQAVGSGITTWEWEVTPEKAGRRRLTLTVDAFVRMDGQSVPRTLRTFDHPIDVEVTATQRIGGWLEEHGKWAWSALLVPLWAWWSRRRKQGDSSAAA